MKSRKFHSLNVPLFEQRPSNENSNWGMRGAWMFLQTMGAWETFLALRAGREAAFYSRFFFYQKGDFKSGLIGDAGKSQWLAEKLLEWLSFEKYQWALRKDERNGNHWASARSSEDTESPASIISQPSCPTPARIAHDVSYITWWTLIFAHLISIPVSSSKTELRFRWGMATCPAQLLSTSPCSSAHVTLIWSMRDEPGVSGNAFSPIFQRPLLHAFFSNTRTGSLEAQQTAGDAGDKPKEGVPGPAAFPRFC